MVRQGWNELATREILEQPACRNLFLWSAISMIPLQIGYHILIMATTLQKWLNVIPGMMWLVSILLLIFYLTKSTSKPYLIATYVYFLLTSAAQGFMVGLSIYIAVGSLDLWQWAGDKGIYWGVAAFSLAEIFQITFVEMMFRITAMKIKARLGSRTFIKKF